MQVRADMRTSVTVTETPARAGSAQLLLAQDLDQGVADQFAGAQLALAGAGGFAST